MRLGYSGRVPGRMVGRVGVDGGRISPCVHENGAGRGWASDRCRTVDNSKTESGLESSYMEQFDAWDRLKERKRKRFRYDSGEKVPPCCHQRRGGMQK